MAGGRLALLRRVMKSSLIGASSLSTDSGTFAFRLILTSGATLMHMACLTPILLILAVFAATPSAAGDLCGNNVIDLGESCDDGNHNDGDACSSRCQIEASQTKEQQKCIVVLNGLTTKLVDRQGRVNSGCFKNAGRGKLRGDQSLADCLLIEGERKSRSMAAKIAIAQDGTPQSPGRTKCPEMPNFGYADDEVLVATALAESRRFLQRVIVVPPEELVIDASVPENKYAALCQLLLLKTSDQLLRAQLKEFSFCQKRLLGDKSNPAVSAEDLEICFAQSQADAKGKVEKARARIEGIYDRKCSSFDVALNEVMGVPEDRTISAFTETVMVAGRCATCRVLNATEGLRQDCDLWDDQVTNQSCVDEIMPSARGAFVDGPVFAHF